jgi:ribosomal protein S18 acetylase RimI-like enzyme
MTPIEYEIRLAGPADASTVRKLDDLAFAVGGQAAEPGELEAGVAAGDIHVLIHAGEPVAYLHADTSRAGRIYVAGVAVHPDLQGRKLGSALVDHMLALLGDERHVTPVLTVTSPSNTRMLKALLRRGFVARWFLADYFGPGYDRFGCQLLPVPPQVDPAHRVRVPVARLDQIAELIRTGDFAVCSLVGSGATPIEFELFPVDPSAFLVADVPNHIVDPAERHHEQLARALDHPVVTRWDV